MWNQRPSLGYEHEQAVLADFLLVDCSDLRSLALGMHNTTAIIYIAGSASMKKRAQYAAERVWLACMPQSRDLGVSTPSHPSPPPVLGLEIFSRG